MADDVLVGDSGPKGNGVFAARSFRAGDSILRFKGRVVQRDEVPRLSAWEREHLAELTSETYQVLRRPRCYVNHSCAPNSVSTSDTVYARQDITAGEEITIDYRLNAYDDGDVWEMVCLCEMAPAGHVVRGDFFSLPADVQKEYLSEAPPFIQQMYRERIPGCPAKRT